MRRSTAVPGSACRGDGAARVRGTAPGVGDGRRVLTGVGGRVAGGVGRVGGLVGGVAGGVGGVRDGRVAGAVVAGGRVGGAGVTRGVGCRGIGRQLCSWGGVSSPSVSGGATSQAAATRCVQRLCAAQAATSWQPRLCATSTGGIAAASG